MRTIVGRDTEWSAIEGFLERSAEGPAALVIEGAAGIGKTTLWLEAVAAARDRGFVVLASRPAESERLLANVVLGDLFERVGPEQLAALPAPRRRAFESALLMRDDPTVGVDDRALGVAIVTLLPVLGGGSPVLLAIDDDQWMDPSSATRLAFALRRLSGTRVSLLLARRTPEVPPSTLEDAFEPTSVQRLTVDSLSVGALQALLRQRLGAVFPRPLQLRLHEVSGGNPFFALEIARARSTAPTAGGATALAIPPSLERLVDARLSVLDRESRQALLLIAAHGRIPVASLRATAASPGAIDRARAAGVIEIAEDTLRFAHPLLASAVYQGATDDERRGAHRRLATVVHDPVHRARHLALGADRPDAELAATIESAADLARDRGLPSATGELAEHALRLTPPGDGEGRRRRANAAARAHASAGDASRARAIAGEILAEADAGRARAEALILTSAFEGPAAAVALLEEALTEAARSPELQAQIHAGLAEHGYFALTDREAFVDRHARASLRLAERLDDDALRANALSILALIRFNAARPGALGLAERAYRLASQLNDPDQMKKAGWAVGHVLTWMGDADRARDWLERRLADWTDRDEPARADFLWYLALVELWAGRASVASDYADESRAMIKEYAGESPYDFFPSALIALHRGDFDRARRLSTHAMSLGDQGQAWKSYSGILGTCDLWSGDPRAAIVHFGRAEASADAAAAYDPSMRHWRADYVEALLQVGRIDEAADLTTHWETAARRLRRQRVLASTLRCRGLIAAARGDVEGAIDLLGEAAQRHEHAGDRFGQARAELALGVTRRRAQQKRSAREAIDAAIAGFEELGAVSWAAAARSELGRIGGRSRISGLSPSELSVAALVAEGRTNREIASNLFLGERTVASHLTHIYAKLGIRSRTELARHFASKVQTS